MDKKTIFSWNKMFIYFILNQSEILQESLLKLYIFLSLNSPYTTSFFHISGYHWTVAWME